QALAAGGRDVVAAAPDVDLLVAVLLRGLRLVQPLQVAVVPLVQRLVALDREIVRCELLEDDRERLLRAHELRREAAREADAGFLQAAAGAARLLASLLGERDVDPAREAVLEVPLGLAVTEEDQNGHAHSLRWHPRRVIERATCDTGRVVPRRATEVARMKVVVDFDKCNSNAVCQVAAPEVFEVREDNFLYVLQENPPESLRAKVQAAVRGCPTKAISSAEAVGSAGDGTLGLADAVRAAAQRAQLGKEVERLVAVAPAEEDALVAEELDRRELEVARARRRALGPPRRALLARAMSTQVRERHDRVVAVAPVDAERIAPDQARGADLRGWSHGATDRRPVQGTEPVRARQPRAVLAVVALLSAASPASAGQVVAPSDALSHVGESVVVEGHVDSVVCSPQACLLSFEPGFSGLVVAIPGDAVGAFPDPDATYES